VQSRESIPVSSRLDLDDGSFVRLQISCGGGTGTLWPVQRKRSISAERASVYRSAVVHVRTKTNTVSLLS
jgi:hypothetical protein